MNKFSHLSIIPPILHKEKGLSLNRPLSVAKRPLYWINFLTINSDIQRRWNVWKYLRRGTGSKHNRRYSAKLCSTIAPLPPGSTGPVTYCVDRQYVIDDPHCMIQILSFFPCFSLFPANTIFLSNYYSCWAWISVGVCPSLPQNLFTLSWKTIYTKVYWHDYPGS